MFINIATLQVNLLSLMLSGELQVARKSGLFIA